MRNIITVYQLVLYMTPPATLLWLGKKNKTLYKYD